MKYKYILWLENFLKKKTIAELYLQNMALKGYVLDEVYEYFIRLKKGKSEKKAYYIVIENENYQDKKTNSISETTNLVAVHGNVKYYEEEIIDEYKYEKKISDDSEESFDIESLLLIIFAGMIFAYKVIDRGMSDSVMFFFRGIGLYTIVLPSIILIIAYVVLIIKKKRANDLVEEFELNIRFKMISCLPLIIIFFGVLIF